MVICRRRQILLRSNINKLHNDFQYLQQKNDMHLVSMETLLLLLTPQNVITRSLLIILYFNIKNITYTIFRIKATVGTARKLKVVQTHIYIHISSHAFMVQAINSSIRVLMYWNSALHYNMYECESQVQPSWIHPNIDGKLLILYYILYVYTSYTLLTHFKSRR